MLALGGEEDDRRALLAVGLQAAQHLEAVELGQHQVEDDEVGVALARDPQRLDPVAGRGGGVAGALEVAGDHLGDRRLVVDDEHGTAIRLLRHLLDCRSGRSHPKVKA